MDLAAGTTFPSEALVTCVGTVPTRALHNLTMTHPPGSKAWWGRGTSRDVMTLLLRDKVISTTYRSPPPVAASGIEGAIVTYV